MTCPSVCMYMREGSWQQAWDERWHIIISLCPSSSGTVGCIDIGRSSGKHQGCVGSGYRCQDGAGGKEKLGHREGAFLRGKKPKFRPLGTFISKTVEKKESVRQTMVDDQIYKEGNSRQRKVLWNLCWWIYESHISNTVEIALECNELAESSHHLFQRLCWLFFLTSIKWGLSIWKHVYKWNLGSPRSVTNLGFFWSFLHGIVSVPQNTRTPCESNTQRSESITPEEWRDLQICAPIWSSCF